MKVLYVNHTSLVSGGEHSLLALVEHLPAEVEPAIACPEGPLEQAARGLGVPTHRLRGTAGSLRLHPWHTPKALAELSWDALKLGRLAARLGVDVVHANSVRAGLSASLGARRGAPPLIVHVRDVLPPGRATEMTRRLVSRRAAAIVSNSQYTERAFVAPGSEVRTMVAFSPIDLVRFDPDRRDRTAARERLGLDASAVAAGVVAQLTPWKGQEDAIRALGLLRDSRPELRLLLVGSAKFSSSATRYDNLAYTRSLERLVDELGLGGRVEFLGERRDVPEIMRALDLVLVPSWEEPFGRSVGEAMAMGVPVAATEVGGPAELIGDGQEGLLVAPRRPDLWAAALERLIDDGELRKSMGLAGRKRAAEELDVRRHAERLVSLYSQVLQGA